MIVWIVSNKSRKSACADQSYSHHVVTCGSSWNPFDEINLNRINFLLPLAHAAQEDASSLKSRCPRARSDPQPRGQDIKRKCRLDGNEWRIGRKESSIVEIFLWLFPVKLSRGFTEVGTPWMFNSCGRTRFRPGMIDEIVPGGSRWLRPSAAEFMWGFCYWHLMQGSWYFVLGKVSYTNFPGYILKKTLFPYQIKLFLFLFWAVFWIIGRTILTAWMQIVILKINLSINLVSWAKLKNITIDNLRSVIFYKIGRLHKI